MDVLDGMSMWLDHRNDLLERRLHCFSKQTRECHIAKQMSQSKFVELPLALEVLTNSKIRI